jgi:predicted HNH restriction endonuclease
LQCHHPDYEHKGGSFFAELRDIITLCDGCHRKIHGSTPGAPVPG